MKRYKLNRYKLGHLNNINIGFLLFLIFFNHYNNFYLNLKHLVLKASHKNFPLTVHKCKIFICSTYR